MLVSVSRSHFQDCVILWNTNMVRGIFLDRVDYITDLGIVIDCIRMVCEEIAR
jgi:hypothetical protein